MKGLNWQNPSFIATVSLVAFAIFLVIVFANPTVDLQLPTDSNNTYLNRNFTFINISTNDTDIDYVYLEWNGTNITIDSPQLVLSTKFEDAYYNASLKNITDSSRYSNNGTYLGETFNNGSIKTNQMRWVTGKYGLAINFSAGTGTPINISHTQSLNFSATNKFTLEMWVNFNTSAITCCPAFAGKATLGSGSEQRNEEWRWWFSNTTKTMTITVYNDTKSTGVNGLKKDWQNYTWYHIAMVYNDSDNNITLFVNGVRDKSSRITTTGLMNSSSAGLELMDGGGSWGGMFNGSMDNVRIWNRNLSDDEINASMNSAYPATRTGLVASYEMEEGSGSTIYDTHNQLAGKYGAAMSFNGTQYVKIPDSSALNFSKEFAIDAWIYHTNTTVTDMTIAAKWGTAPQMFTFKVNVPTNKLGFAYGLGNNKNGVSQIPKNTWTHVAFTYDNSSGRFYINGVLDNTHSASYMNTSANPVYIGSLNGAQQFFNGSIDSVRMWSKNLSTSEVSALYRADMGKYNATSFYANMTDLDDGLYSYSVIINNTAGAFNQSAYRAVTIESHCGIPDTAPWTITLSQCTFIGRNLSTISNLTLINGANLTLINSNITFNGTEKYVVVNAGSKIVINSGSKMGG